MRRQEEAAEAAAITGEQPASGSSDDPSAPSVQPTVEQTDSRTLLGDVTSTIVDAAVDAAHAGMSVARAARRPVDSLASGARRRFDERSGARVRRVRQMARQPLANLWDLHPEARRAAIRELGVQTVPVDKIAGTAVEGAPQRGGDFLPLRERRGDDWRARWQRILKAVDGLANLPAIELIKLGESYWVVDGHNRVAAALYNGQVAIDAEVAELRVAGVPRDRTPTTIASMLEGSSDVREAGAGRLTRTSSRPQRMLSKPARGPAHPNAERPSDEDRGPADPGAS